LFHEFYIEQLPISILQNGKCTTKTCYKSVVEHTAGYLATK